MTGVDVFYLVMAVCFGVITVFLSWACYRLIKTLGRVDYILNEVKGVTDEIEVFKSGIKMGLVSIISALVNRLRVTSKEAKEVKTNE